MATVDENTAIQITSPAMAMEMTAEELEKHHQPHKLERKWTFWLDNLAKNKPGAWGGGLRKIYGFDTVEEFWCLYDQIPKPSKLPVNVDFHLFRSGIEPKWEDPECATGGKWSAVANKSTNFDTIWLETMMALIGEQFDEVDEICGVVAGVRPRQDKVSLWTKTASNESIQMSIGRKWKGIIDVPDQITYNSHDVSKKASKIQYKL